jgi:Mce-associated membrane protein
VSKPQFGKRRLPIRRTRKGTIPVRAEAETETVTGQDAAVVSAENAEQSAIEIDEPEDTGDAENTRDTEHIEESEDTSSDDAEPEDAEDVEPRAHRRGIKWSRVLAFGVLPVLVLLIAAGAGYLKWQDALLRGSGVAAIESVAAAKDSTAALLSYQPDTVEKDLGAASDRLTGTFKNSYTQLIHDVVIPGAKKQHISAVATVPAAASVSATPQHAVVLVYVDQMVTVGNDAPSETASTVRVSLDKAGARWFISSFDPI